MSLNDPELTRLAIAEGKSVTVMGDCDTHERIRVQATRREPLFIKGNQPLKVYIRPGMTVILSIEEDPESVKNVQF